MTGIGPVPVKVPRVRDRGAGEDNISFMPSILSCFMVAILQIVIKVGSESEVWNYQA
jgi:hypothetical protein